ncbi:hypothetical protein CYMTET_40408 [Cymbomonas tetramitiformis]|uniref:Uncharacterized protein n=1 Tax=Cymbomonas tetramitiformis TaxID=36881 RepID=A0AAE0C9C8_9CHLO|nr:hypothetical protein CYMTET_40408 [Cymbomonas tetramitiformis]
MQIPFWHEFLAMTSGRFQTEEALRRAHRHEREDFQELLLKSSHKYACCVGGLEGTNVKPRREPSRECLPIHASELVESTTHRSRLLRGQLVDKPVFTGKSVGVLLRDEEDAIVKVYIYKWHGVKNWEQNPMEALKRMDTHFAEGTLLGINEPYFKRFADGNYGVRVDDPTEVKWLQDLGPTDAPSWQSEGNSHFRMKQYKEAIQCYTKGLGLSIAADDALLVKLMLNISNCYIKLHAPADSLQWAAAVTSMIHDGPLAAKAWLRIGQALEQQQLYSNAQIMYKHAATVHGSCSRASAEALERLKSLPGHERVPAGKHAYWQVLSQVLAESATSCSQEGSLPHLSACAAEKGIVSADFLTQKDAGNAKFRSGQYAAALETYVSSLQAYVHEPKQTSTSTPQPLWPLLANCAQCHLALGEYVGAAQCASAVVLMKPEHAKAQYRRALGLLNLDHLAASQAACQQGLSACPDEKHLLELEARIASLVKAGRSSKTGSAATKDMPTKPAEEIHYAHKLHPSNTASVEELAMANQLVEMATASGKLPPGSEFALDSRIPPFHTEFSQGGFFPPGCNSQKASRLLRGAYELGRGGSGEKLRLGISKRLDNKPMPELHDLAMRLGSTREEELMWYCNAPMGSYRVHESSRYGTVHQQNKAGSSEMPSTEQGHKLLARVMLCHSFSNTACRKEILTLGTTHVAVGFVDLGTLLHATLHPASDDNYGRPLRWVGYELSPYACAKTMVINQLFKDQASEDDILQVWFSSSWSNSAHTSFRKALSTVLQAESEDLVSREVLVILSHWQAHDVSLVQARELWLEDVEKHNCISKNHIGNWKQTADRLALCSYLITGEILQGQVGSVTMFALPENLTRADEENFLYTIPQSELWESRRNSGDIVSAGVAIMRLKIRELKQAFSLDRVKVEVHHTPVEPEKQETLKSIAAMRPWTMSWSNVCDYFSPADFHAMARACSASEDTVHYGYSMNWSRSVMGASSLDFFGNRDALDGIIKTAHKAIDFYYAVQGLQDILLFPPNANMMNIADAGLTVSMMGIWLKGFFSFAGLKSFERQVMRTQGFSFSVLQRTTSDLFMTWTYDPSINFLGQQANDPAEQMQKSMKAMHILHS